MSRHLIIGASGQVGQHLLQAARESGLEGLGTYNASPAAGLRKLDVRDREEVFAVISTTRPGTIYLPASLTHVDYCELHPEETRSINVSGVRNVVDAAREAGAKVVYFSSDYVFDGRSGGYSESSEPNPINEYGRQKLEAEHYVASYAPGHLIVRTAGVFGWERQGKNFITRLLQTLKSGRGWSVPADQINNPTYAPNLARAVLELALEGGDGLFHVCGPEPVDRYSLACEAGRLFGLDPSLITPCATADLGQIAPRPLNASMVVEKAARRLKLPLMGYRDGLAAMAAEQTPAAPEHNRAGAL
jgi:dTDP-4-dehydrorhamnose reductase